MNIYDLLSLSTFSSLLLVTTSLGQTITPAPEPEIPSVETTPAPAPAVTTNELADKAAGKVTAPISDENQTKATQPASSPAAIPPSTELDKPKEVGPFHSTFEIYEAAREIENITERDVQLKIAASKIAQLLKLYPQHADSLKAKYRRGTALNLTGDVNTANEIFFEIVHQNKVDSYVGTAAFRLGINHFNAKEWPQALEYFDIAWRQSTKDDVSNKALQYKIQCLTKLSRTPETISALEALIKDPFTTDELKQTAMASKKKLSSQ